MRVAYQGSDLMNFQNTSWWPSPKGGRRAQQVCTVFNVVNVRTQAQINDICPHFLLGLLDAGKTDLQRQGQSCSLSPTILSLHSETCNISSNSGRKVAKRERADGGGFLEVERCVYLK